MIPEIYPLYTWTTWEVTKGNIAPMPRGLRQRNDTAGAAIQFIVGILSPFSWLPPDADEHRGFQRCALIQSLNQVAIGDHHVHNHHHCSFKKPWVHVWVWIFRFGTHHCPVVAICGHAFLNGNLGPPHWLVDGIIWWPYTQKTLLLQQQPRDCTAKSWPAWMPQGEIGCEQFRNTMTNRGAFVTKELRGSNPRSQKPNCFKMRVKETK